MRVFLIAIAVMLLGAAPARAAGVLERAADTLRLDPIYVDPDAQRSIADSEGDDLRAQIADDEAAPLYIALLPAAAADEAGGSPASALAEIVRDVREPGVYAAVVGDTFVAGATEGQLPRGVAQQLAQASLA